MIQVSESRDQNMTNKPNSFTLNQSGSNVTVLQILKKSS